MSTLSLHKVAVGHARLSSIGHASQFPHETWGEMVLCGQQLHTKGQGRHALSASGASRQRSSAGVAEGRDLEVLGSWTGVTRASWDGGFTCTAEASHGSSFKWWV